MLKKTLSVALTLGVVSLSFADIPPNPKLLDANIVYKNKTFSEIEMTDKDSSKDVLYTQPLGQVIAQVYRSPGDTKYSIQQNANYCNIDTGANPNQLNCEITLTSKGDDSKKFKFDSSYDGELWTASLNGQPININSSTESRSITFDITPLDDGSLKLESRF
jgi:hypothetical protein